MVFMFNQWDALLNFNKINARLDERGDHNYFLNLSEGYSNNNFLSPNTIVLINSWVNLINSKKNLIVNFPDNMLRPIPLLAHLFSRITNKSTLIFTSGNTNLKNHINRLHNRHYQLLYYSDTGRNICEYVPIGIIKKDSIEYVPHVIHIRNQFKEENKNRIRNNLISSDNPKVLLNGSDNLTKLSKVVNNVLVDEDVLNNIDVKLDVGAIIFENANRFITSSSVIDKFIEWLFNFVEDDVLLLFHFSKHNTDEFISQMKKKTNSFVLDFNNAILQNNVLYDNSLDYFNNLNFSNLKILNNYNLDLRRNYDFDYNISIIEPALFKGNIDFFMFNAQRTLNEINENTIKNKRFYSRLINLLFVLPNLAIDPALYKLNFQLAPGLWRRITIPDFIRIFKSELNIENSLNNILLKRLISNLNSMYYELTYCKHYWENNNYERINKNYRLLDIANNKEKYFKEDKHLLIGTFQDSEPRILNNYLMDLDDVEVMYLRDILNKSEDLSDYNLLLPGVISNSKFTSILERNFNQILILAYDGFNKTIIQKQIDFILNPSIENEKNSIEYFKEIFKYFNIPTNNDFFKDFDNRYDEYIKSITIIEEDKEQKIEKKSIKDLFGNYNTYLKVNEKCKKDMDKSLLNDSTSHHQDYNYETIDITLENLNDNKIYVKKLSKNKKYLRFKDYTNLDSSLDVKPDLLKKNDFVIVLDDNKSFLEIYMDIFEEDINIDKNLIDYWRDLLHDYVTTNNLKVKNVYENFDSFLNENNYPTISYNTFRLWVNGYAIAPLKKEYLKYLAEFLNDDYLNENHDFIFEEANKLRTINRNMGRKLSYIIKEIIQNTGLIDFELLSFEEKNMYDIIKNSVYQVISVN